MPKEIMGVRITEETAADANRLEKFPDRRSMCAKVGKGKRRRKRGTVIKVEEKLVK